ncbi:hypothetical protein [Alsobacter sp. R-9]
MTREPPRPADVARRLARRSSERQQASTPRSGGWQRETFCLPRDQAREKARETFTRFPKAAYMTEIEWWRELDDGQIEFTIRRLPSAD